MLTNHPFPGSLMVGCYARRSSVMQADNFSMDAQKRAMAEECQRRGLSFCFYEDDERSARGGADR